MRYTWVLASEAARQSGISRERVRQLIADGRLRAKQVGRNVFVAREELEERYVLSAATTTDCVVCGRVLQTSGARARGRHAKCKKEARHGAEQQGQATHS